jgi:serine/threonine protein kinase
VNDEATEVPIAQSRIVTEVAPAAFGDPMASIRPQLPESPPLLAPTLELSNLFQNSEQPSAIDPTLEPPAGKREHQAPPTHATGPVISVVEPNVPQGSSDPPEAHGEAAYQLRRQIGVGGMGEVWEAQQRELGRTVALKRLREGKQSPANVRLFKSEARLTAILDHPNIVTVHELGRDQTGRMFYTMKMIEGTPWSEVIAAGERRTGDGNIVKVELRDHLDILVEVSQAIAFAHSRGVIHRDIKPGNVMIGDYGDIQVVDWGLAVALQPLPALGRAETWTLADLPSSALVCGTPAYMSPETATAQRELIGTATDVYLLGAVLFHLLYDRPPHKGKSVEAVISKAKVNAWVIPDEIPPRLRPWDALLRPVITQALASDPSDRYADAEQFREALREAIRNYESAKVSSRAQEELAEILEQFTNKAPGTPAYPRLAAMIARLEGALDSWPRNLAARQVLAQARLELARQALANGDLALANLSLDAFDRIPTLPEPDPSRVVRRLTVHPVDGTLVNAPRPTDSLVAAGTSNQWVSSAAELGRRTPSSNGSLARTIDAVELARASEISDSGPIQRTRSTSSSLRMGGAASVEIQQETDETLVDEAEHFKATAIRLRHQLATRERSRRLRRISLWIAAGVIGVLGATALYGQRAVYHELSGAHAERDELSKVLLDETANTVEAQLDVLFTPVDGALTTALAWARAGDLDADHPSVLNHHYIPLLHGLETATSALRADTAGNEYMLSRERDGWRTRMTAPVGDHLVYTLGRWTPAGELLAEERTDDLGYDPEAKLWYIGGAELRGQAPPNKGEPQPVFWTPPYRSTTNGLGISISAPAASPSGREFVLAFDVELGGLSSITGNLPRGQVFVLDERLQVLALPRETNELSLERRNELLLTPMIELEDAPISSAAVREWQNRGNDGPFELELGDASDDKYWAYFRKVDKPRRPRVWIGVIVPESHVL